MSKENKTLMVFGASSDMGIELIKRTYKNYGKIIAQYRKMNSSLESMSRELPEGELFLIQADLADRVSVEKLIKNTNEQGYFPDNLVYFPMKEIMNNRFNKIDIERFDEDYEIGVRALVKILKSFIPHMTKQKYGRIIILLSYLVEWRVEAYCSDYLTTKYADLGLLRGLAKEYAEKGITVNGVSPSPVETKFIRNMPELLVEQLKEGTIDKRLLSPEDVVPAIEFLLSDDAKYINGQNIVISNRK